MCTSRLPAIVALLLSACAGWDSAEPSYAQPPVEEPLPSHHAPRAPEAALPEVPAEDEPEYEDRLRIASVSLLDSCEVQRHPECMESRVQIAIGSGRPGKFRIRAARLLDEQTGKVIATITPSRPTRWSDDADAYVAWDQRVAARTKLRTSYILGDLQPTPGNGPDSALGYLVLELDVTIGVRRQTLRASHLRREDPFRMVT